MNFFSILITFSFLLLLYSNYVNGNKIIITNENDFSILINNVKSGTNYSGTTVYLNSDISFSKNIEPVGSNSTHFFSGTFDGQGYIISNLNINSTLNYIGLFGYSNGLTVRNVIIDSSCSFTSTYVGSNAVSISGIIGRCDSNYNQCNIENVINMANITFSGNISTDSNSLYISGIVGVLCSSKNDTVKTV